MRICGWRLWHWRVRMSIYVFQERQKWTEGGCCWSIDIRTQRRRKTNIFFYLIWLTLAPFSPGSRCFWCPQGRGSPHRSISPLLFLALWNSLPFQVPGSDKSPRRHAADISDCSHRVLEKRNVLVLVRRLYRQMSAVCVCGQLCFIFYGGENIFRLFVPGVKGRVWCKNVYGKFLFA